MRLGALMIGQVGFDYKHALLQQSLAKAACALSEKSQSKYIVLALLVAFFSRGCFWFSKMRPPEQRL